MRALLFGSSARRGATGWTDAARVRDLLLTAAPDVVIEGESPCGGADALAREVAESLGMAVDPYPQRDDVDGPRGYLRRNERMHRDGKPDVAAGFISGKVGAPMSSGSVHMAGVCVRAGTPLVVVREDGVELPHVTDPECRGDRIAGDLYHARRMLVGLCRLPWARDDVIPAGIAVAEALKAARAMAPTRDVVPLVTAAWNQVEVLRGKCPRLAPWIEVVEALVRRNAGA